MVRITLLSFGVLKDLLANQPAAIDLVEGTSVQSFLDRLDAAGTVPLALRRSLAVAVNREYARPETVLEDGDEVALLPPVSGGSHAR